MIFSLSRIDVPGSGSASSNAHAYPQAPRRSRTSIHHQSSYSPNPSSAAHVFHPFARTPSQISSYVAHRRRWIPSMTARHKNVRCVPGKPLLGGDDIGCSPRTLSSSSGQAGGGHSCCCFPTTPSSSTTMLIHHCSCFAISSQKQACFSSSSPPQKPTRLSCPGRSEIHANEMEVRM